MGIPGLLPLLKSVVQHTHLRELRGLRCGVDGYAWLHRGAMACATELCTGEDSDLYVDFFIAMVEQLAEFTIVPHIVFDGNQLPSKKVTEVDRESKRSVAQREGERLLAAGKGEEASANFAKALDVTPEMAHRVIKELRKRGINVTVAPYEADAQLAYLSISNLIDMVITEDSDLLPYGCSRVLYKLDKSGFGQLIELRRLPMVSDVSLVHFTPDMFLDMCILGGCDYLPSLPGMGIRRAHGFVQRYRTTRKLMQGIRVELGSVVPADFEQRFARARMTFRHQTVFCPTTQQVVPLSPIISPPESIAWGEFDFLGPSIPRELAIGVAKGDLHPVSLEPFERAALPATLPAPVLFPSLQASVPAATLAPSLAIFARKPPSAVQSVGAENLAPFTASRTAPTAVGTVGARFATANPFASSTSSSSSSSLALSRPPPSRPPSFAQFSSQFSSRFVSPHLRTLPPPSTSSHNAPQARLAATVSASHAVPTPSTESSAKRSFVFSYDDE